MNSTSLYKATFFLSMLLLPMYQQATWGQNNLKVWSDKPAFTKLLANEIEPEFTSDLWDGIWEGDSLPALPRVQYPASTPQYKYRGEGRDLQDEETLMLTDGKYSNPERIWEGEPYPIGNGRIAASVFHGSGRDRYSLNEISFWSGGENKGTINAKGDKRYNINGAKVDTNGFGSYQPVGDLIVDFDAPVRKGTFSREIDLSNGIVHAKAVRRNTTMRNTAFCSHPHQIIVIHYDAGGKERINASICFAKQREEDWLSVSKNCIELKSQLPNGMQCNTHVTISYEGGELRTNDKRLLLCEVKSCTLLVAIETNYVMDYARNWQGEDPDTKISQRMDAVLGISYKQLLKSHEKDYRSLFERQQLQLYPSNTRQAQLPTPQRLEAYRKNPNDTSLEELLFNFGRYLMISTSRGDALPGGLQGIWNGMVAAPWGNDYHSNINFQMVYWLPEVGNLPDSHLSMINYLWATREANTRATKEYLQAIGKTYDAEDKGWIVYTSHNPFGGNGWQVNLPGSAWYALHIWEHFAFTQDTCYLRQKGYPMMKEISQFWEKHLKTLGEGGKGFESNYKQVDTSLYPELKRVKAGTLVVPNGWSPEHGPRGEDGVTHDQQIISELFLNTIKAAQILGVDSLWITNLQLKQSRLYPSQIGKKGNLMEWMIDRDPVTEHRHTSHLFAVYPGSSISREATPELAEAARRSLLFRKNVGVSRRSWAWTWRAMLWARLQDGNKAHEMLEGLITYNMLDNLLATHHIPLQIDGNYGIAAAMLEMLVQSHNDIIQLLPSPTLHWPKGSIKGAKARGNITIDMSWENGKVTKWELYSPHPTLTKVKVNGTYTEVLPAPLSRYNKL